MVVEEKKAWVGWQPDGDATAPRRADLQMRREAEQVAESGCIAGSGQEGSALELCYSTPRSAGWVQPVCCSLSTFHSDQMVREYVRLSRERRLKEDWGGGVRLREIVNAVIPSLREKTLVVQKCWDFITVAVNFC